MKKKIFVSLVLLLLLLISGPMSAVEKICSDEVFIRRASIALTGRLSQADRVKLFLASNQTNKRQAYVDELLESEAYSSYISMRWGDILRIKSEFPSNLWPNGVQAYNRWIYDHINQNTPYNQMVSELLLSKGSNYKMPAVNFYRAFPVRNAENFYKNINLLFLGRRTCDSIGQVFFSQLKFKSTKEWKEEIIFTDNQTIANSKSLQLPDGSTANLSPDTDWRVSYVAWLTSNNNRRFAEVMVNRMYYWLMGKGIVHEPDDWGQHNPPSNAVLLKQLTDEFIASGFDTKKTMRTIVNSPYFQSATNFEPQRLLAEVLVDALADVTGISDSYRSRVPEPFTFYPEGTRSVELGDATVSSSALELFGRSSRDVSLDSQHTNTLTDRQILYLLNSMELEQKIRKSPRIKQIVEKTKNTNELCNELMYGSLSRKATKAELQLFADYAATNKLTRQQLAWDVTWMIINSSEFLYQR